MRPSSKIAPYVVHLIAAILALLVYARAGAAQGSAVSEWSGNGQVVVPQLGGFPLDGSASLFVTATEWRVRIDGPLAVVTLEVSIENRSMRAAEAEMLLPVPRGAAVRSFDFLGEGAEPSARLIHGEEARRSYNAIVARAIDPALLEFQGAASIRTSVFPVPPRGAQRVKITYEQIVEGDGSRFDFVLPRSEAWRKNGPSLVVDLEVRGLGHLSAVWSSTHELVVDEHPDHVYTARLAKGAAEQPGSFRLSMLRGSAEPGATLFAHGDPRGEGGTFLLLGALPPATKEPRPRELALVLDRSGSMAGEKFDQARTAAIGVLESLRAADRFQLVAFSGAVKSFSREAQPADPETIQSAIVWLRELKTGGGTNISDALAAVLAPAPEEGLFPLVLLMTDGQPTVGLTEESALHQSVEHLNTHDRRVHLLGVGHDVNAPLLDRIARDSRGSTQYAHPMEDVGLALGRLAARLAEPRLTHIEYTVIGGDGKPDPSLAQQLAPARLEDLFEGEQLTLLGRYNTGVERLGIRLSGELDGERSAYSWIFDLSAASPDNAFVSRLWAQRRIASLVDHVRHGGAVPGSPVAKELVEEVRSLSQTWGVLSEYTAFLALEGTDLADADGNRSALAAGLVQRAQRTRTGAGGVVQSVNQNRWRRGQRFDRLNRFLDEQLREVGPREVQHVGERAFFLRGGKWVDTRLFEGGAEAVAEMQMLAAVAFGSEAYVTFSAWLTDRGLGGVLALPGDVFVEVEGRAVWLPRPQRPVASALPANTEPTDATELTAQPGVPAPSGPPGPQLEGGA